jgi:hypothetical protein
VSAVPIFGVWSPTKRKLLRRIHDRLTRTAGCETVRYNPSHIDANEVIAAIDPERFLSRQYSTGTAQLRVEFSLQTNRPQYWIQWWETDTGRSIGWHQDDTEPTYGPVHLQVEYEDGTTNRETASHVADEHPYRTFERRLSQIDDVIADLGWE